MPQGWISLARIAGIHGLKTADAQEAAYNVGISARRGAALLSPAQQAMLHPELRRIKAEQTIRQFNRPTWPKISGPAVYKVTDVDAGFIEGQDDIGHLGFTNGQMREQLEPIRRRLEDEA